VNHSALVSDWLVIEVVLVRLWRTRFLGERLAILVDANAFGSHGYVSGREISPAAGVVIGDAFAVDGSGFVCMSAEDPIYFTEPGVLNSAG
jgi:hypothetical protein